MPTGQWINQGLFVSKPTLYKQYEVQNNYYGGKDESL